MREKFRESFNVSVPSALRANRPAYDDKVGCKIDRGWRWYCKLWASCDLVPQWSWTQRYQQCGGGRKCGGFYVFIYSKIGMKRRSFPTFWSQYLYRCWMKMDDISREISADVPVFAPRITRNKIYALHSVRVYITGIPCIWGYPNSRSRYWPWFRRDFGHFLVNLEVHFQHITQNVKLWRIKSVLGNKQLFSRS